MVWILLSFLFSAYLYADDVVVFFFIARTMKGYGYVVGFFNAYLYTNDEVVDRSGMDG